MGTIRSWTKDPQKYMLTLLFIIVIPCPWIMGTSDKLEKAHKGMEIQ